MAYDRKPYLDCNRKSQGVYTDGLQRLISVTGSPFLPISCLGLSLLILYLGLQSLVTHALMPTHEPIAVVRAKLRVCTGSRAYRIPKHWQLKPPSGWKEWFIILSMVKSAVIPALGRLKQGGDEFEGGLSIIARSCLKLLIKTKMRADETHL